MLQAYLHHRVVTDNITPISWITDQLHNVMEERLHNGSRDNLEYRLRQILKGIDSYSYRYQELGSLIGTIENIIRLIQKESHDEALGRLAAQIAHDMKSPLTVFRTVFRQIDNIADGTSAALLQKTAHTSLSKLTQMSDDLCNVAKANHIEYVDTELVGIIEQVMEEVRSGSDSRTIELRYVGPIELHTAIDKNKFNRVLTNLVWNAVQAIPKTKEGIVTVSLESSGAAIKLSVRDNGIGINQEVMPSLFRKYFTTKGANGNGLGLAYCKEVIEAHGGEISVRSVPDSGSTFTLLVPTSEAEKWNKASC